MNQPIISATDIVLLLERQIEIADNVYNMEYEFEEDSDEAEGNYYASINILYQALGENTPCELIDPLLFRSYSKKVNKPNKQITRREVQVELGTSH